MAGWVVVEHGEGGRRGARRGKQLGQVAAQQAGQRRRVRHLVAATIQAGRCEGGGTVRGGDEQRGEDDRDESCSPQENAKVDGAAAHVAVAQALGTTLCVLHRVERMGTRDRGGGSGLRCRHVGVEAISRSSAGGRAGARLIHIMCTRRTVALLGLHLHGAGEGSLPAVGSPTPAAACCFRPWRRSCPRANSSSCWATCPCRSWRACLACTRPFALRGGACKSSTPGSATHHRQLTTSRRARTSLAWSVRVPLATSR